MFTIPSLDMLGSCGVCQASSNGRLWPEEQFEQYKIILDNLPDTLQISGTITRILTTCSQEEIETPQICLSPTGTIVCGQNLESDGKGGTISCSECPDEDISLPGSSEPFVRSNKTSTLTTIYNISGILYKNPKIYECIPSAFDTDQILCRSSGTYYFAKENSVKVQCDYSIDLSGNEITADITCVTYDNCKFEPVCDECPNGDPCGPIFQGGFCEDGYWLDGYSGCTGVYDGKSCCYVKYGIENTIPSGEYNWSDNGIAPHIFCPILENIDNQSQHSTVVYPYVVLGCYSNPNTSKIMEPQENCLVQDDVIPCPSPLNYSYEEPNWPLLEIKLLSKDITYYEDYPPTFPNCPAPPCQGISHSCYFTGIGGYPPTGLVDAECFCTYPPNEYRSHECVPNLVGITVFLPIDLDFEFQHKNAETNDFIGPWVLIPFQQAASYANIKEDGSVVAVSPFLSYPWTSGCGTSLGCIDFEEYSEIPPGGSAQINDDGWIGAYQIDFSQFWDGSIFRRWKATKHIFNYSVNILPNTGELES